MPRRSREDTALTKEQIVDAAAELVRARGMEGVSIGEIMSAAGLTHGGFYKHFASKEELCAAAIERASNRTASELDKRLAKDDGAKTRAARFAEGYVSKAHRANPAKGCVVAALAGEAARAASEPRAAFTKAVRALLRAIEGDLPAHRSKARQRALANAATAVGALILSRAVEDTALSDELLDAAREEIARAR